MTSDLLPFLTLGVFLIALLYSSVGHAGASGYIAVMSLFSLTPAAIKPTALSLNILVASIAAFQFWRAGHFSWRLFWPLGLCAIPMAFLGGYVSLPTPVFQVLVGMVLLFSAAHFLIRPPAEREPHLPSRPTTLAAGAGLGLLAGFTGTGGGIFLTPLAILLRWGRTKTAAAISAMFILCNSIAGLAGHWSATKTLPLLAVPLAFAVIVGGACGAYLGSSYFASPTIKRLLAIVLAIAGIKLVLTH